ncbi:outer kinetochore KNL1 complex subunit ZWINT isoform X2 [Gorilla gorilla gorilla]|uniref:outer kinetochore KNL1 complex subunit ZWINT isoform X2 n=1 Tax=Gorilla gorilla gorilla TaxID=9595 RepID=UPI003009610E
MKAAETEAEAAALEVLAEVAGILEPVGLQEEAELPAKILVEFVVDSQKKDKLLCSQLQVADFLQNILAQEDTAKGLDPLASEDTSRQKAIAAKEQWKELKATYREHVEAIKIGLTKALTQMEEAQRKRTQLQEAFEQLQAKKQMAMEKRRAVQNQWQLQQEKHLQHLAEVSAEVRERKTGTQQELEGVFQKLGNLKQQAEQEREKLQRVSCCSLRLRLRLRQRIFQMINPSSRLDPRSRVQETPWGETLVCPSRLSVYNLLEMQICHDFLEDSSMEKDPRKGKTVNS